MRKISKFKIFLKTFEFYRCYPNKLLKLNTSKWIKIKNSFKKSLKKRTFLDFSKLHLKQKKFEKVSRFRIKKKIFSTLGQLYDQSLNFNELRLYLKRKKNLNHLLIFKKIFLRIEYRIDIFLWRHSICSNLYDARIKINTGKILINNKKIKQNTFLKKGDIVSINFKFNSKNLINATTSLSFYNSFVEIDYYTNTFIILKNFYELNLNELALFIPKRLDLTKTYKSIT